MSASKTPSQLAQDSRVRREAQDAFDADVSNIASEADMLEQLISIRSFAFAYIKDTSRKLPTESEAVQPDLDLLWHMFLETAKVYPHDSALQEKLVALLLWTKEFDSLHKSLHPTETAAAASWESYGFPASLQASWEQLLTSGTAAQQCNLAAFSAKALAVGVCREQIGLTALWYLREALETSDEAQALRLLPATVIWLEESHDYLLTSSALNQSSMESSQAHLLVPGALAHKADVDGHGFSIKRWLFWRRRLQELSHNTDSAMAKTAKKGFMAMITAGRLLDYEVPGEEKFKEKLQAAMGEELARSGKQSVSGDDIDINVDWVD